MHAMMPTEPTPTLGLLQQELARVRQDNAVLREQLARLQAASASLAKGQTSPAVANPTPDYMLDRLRLVMEAAQMALWEWDVQRGQVYISPRWGAFTGTESRGIWHPVETLLAQVHAEDAPRVQQQLVDVLQGRSQRYAVEHRVQTSKGWVWIESVGLPQERDADGRITRIVGANTDITARKLVQEQLAIAQNRAEQASQSKSEFLANMSHEVRTPLNAIMGLTRLLQRTDISDQQKEYLDLMDGSATALLALLNDVLDLSKIEAGKLVFEQVRFDLLAWVEQAVSPFEAQARDKGLEVAIDAGLGLPQYLVGDPGRLRQVVTNLMSNAVKFTQQGSIRVKVWRDPEPEQVLAGQLRILFEVRDTGIGMSAEQQRGIFDAFTQADPSTTREYGGTGLGLTICWRLVEMMNGQIRVASLPGQGSAFRFSAIFNEAPERPTEITMPVALEARTLAGLVVLLAEDHPVNQLITRKLLEEMGCRVEIAGNGKEAVARWQRGGIDLILMDIQMPVLGGEEATTQIRAQERPYGSRTPIIALTAHALAGNRDRYLSLGMDGYVSKPIAPDTLAQAMHDALDGSDPVPEGLLPAFDFETTAAATLFPASTRPPPEPPPTAAPPVQRSEDNSKGSFDVERLLAQLGGDREALLELAQTMREDLTQRMVQLRIAAATQNADLACGQAHALKGSLATLTLDRGAALAGGLELAGRKSEWGLFARALSLLEEEAVRIHAALGNIT